MYLECIDNKKAASAHYLHRPLIRQGSQLPGKSWKTLFKHTCADARWAHMHRFLSVGLVSLDQCNIAQGNNYYQVTDDDVYLLRPGIVLVRPSADFRPFSTNF